jgi:cysteinyl-tRNA synthetase
MWYKLTEYLAGKVAHPEDCALCCLEDLLKHHLIPIQQRSEARKAKNFEMSDRIRNVFLGCVKVA